MSTTAMMRLAARRPSAAAPLRTAVRHISGKDVRFGNEARALMLAGVDKLADAVQVTLGALVLFWPLGRAGLGAVAEAVQAVLSYGDKGVAFLFGGLVEPGFGGDNVTWRGVGGENSLSLAVGMRLSIGGVRCVVTQFNEPCSNLKPLWRRLAAAEARWPGWPRETTRLTHGITACNGPLGQNTGPGQRGWFARVVQEGEIRVGDEIFAEAPDGPPAKKQRKISSYF